MFVWFSLQLLPETLLILRWNQRNVIINVHWSSCTVPLWKEVWRKLSKSEVKWGERSDVRWSAALVNLSGVKPNDRVVKCRWVKFKWEKVKCRQLQWSGVKFLVTGCLPLLEDIQIIWNLLLTWLFRLSHSVILFWVYFVSLYIWLYVLYASL
jgi:hypothetical protein